MGVGIRYTGTDGKTTSFTATSPLKAMERLRGISGYLPTGADGIAAGLAGGWRERHKARAKSMSSRVAVPNPLPGAKYASVGGMVSEEPSVSSVSVRDGNVIETSRKRFVGEGGATVGYGASVERIVGKVGGGASEDAIKSLKEVIARGENAVKSLKSRVSSVEDAASRRSEELANDKGEAVDLISGIDFDTSNGPLEIKVRKVRARIVRLGDETVESMSIGTRVSIHENVGNDVHALAYVLSRREISMEESKAYAPSPREVGHE